MAKPSITQYGFVKYEHQQTRSFVSGDLMGGAAISTMPALEDSDSSLHKYYDIKAGSILVNLAGTVTVEASISAAISALKAITVTTGQSSTTASIAGSLGAPQIYLVAEDIPAAGYADGSVVYPTKFVAYEILDINNLVARKEPADTPVYIQ